MWDNWIYQSINLHCRFWSINVLQAKPKIDYLWLIYQSFNLICLNMLFIYIILFFLFTWSQAWRFVLPFRLIYILQCQPNILFINRIHLRHLQDSNFSFLRITFAFCTFLEEEGDELHQNLRRNLLLKPSQSALHRQMDLNLLD